MDRKNVNKLILKNVCVYVLFSAQALITLIDDVSRITGLSLEDVHCII